MVNGRVSLVLDCLVDLEPGRTVTITGHQGNFQVYCKGELVVGDLLLSDLKKISLEAVRLGVVQLVNVDDLVLSGQVRSTDAYVKIEDDVAFVFLHLLHKLRFQKPAVAPVLRVEVAV